MVETLVEAPKSAARRDPTKINVLPGCHLTPGDIDELRKIIEDFGLEPTFLPDLSGSLDGHIPDDFTPTTIGGVGVEEIAMMGRPAGRSRSASRCGAPPKRCKQKTGVPFRLFERLTGLEANDALMAFLTRDQRPPGADEISPPAQPAGRRDAGRPFPHRRAQTRDRRRAGPAATRSAGC